MTELQREMNYSAGAWVHTDNSEALKNALNRIADLEAQIEKMKCCQNCKNTWNGYRMNICEDCKRLEGQIFSDTLTSDNWELRS